MSDEDTVRAGDVVDGAMQGSAFIPPAPVAEEAVAADEVPAEEATPEAPAEEAAPEAPETPVEG